MLIHRSKLHKLLVPPPTNAEVIIALVADDLKNNPGDVSFRADMLRVMDKILYLSEPSLKIVESAWHLKDMPLYRRAIRHCAVRDDILNALPKLLATLVSEAPALQVATWSERLERHISFVSQVLALCHSLTLAYLPVSSISWVAARMLAAHSPCSVILGKHSGIKTFKTASRSGRRH